MSVNSSTAQRILYSSRNNSFNSLEATKSESFLRPESPTLLSENNLNGTSSETSSTYSGIINEFPVKEGNYLNLNPTSITGLTDVTNKSPLSGLEIQLEEKSSNHMRQKKSSRSAMKRQDQKMTDHRAAAIEISTTNTITTPAPAAGMYWSRCLTYGRNPSRPIRAHTANLIGEKLYVFGGCDTSACFNTLYILDMDTMTWSKPRLLDQYVPPPCRAHSCTVVEREPTPGKKSSQLYIFGGGNGPDYFQDVYVFDIDTLSWLKPTIDPQSRPPKRRAHTSCLWDDKLFIIGGGDGARALDDVYMLDISNPNEELIKWELIQTVGTAPPARGYHTSNLVKDKLVVFGGSDGHDCFEDVYVLDLPSKTWTQIELDFKVSRLAHTSTQVGSYVFVIGGHDGRRYSQDILLFNLVTMSWEVRKVYGAPPSPRGYHTTVLYDSRLYVIGGYDGKNVFDDVYMLELSACAYLPQITNFEIDI